MANDRPQEQLIKKNPFGEIPPVKTNDKQAQDKCRHSVTINKSPLEVLTIWRDFKHLPLFMKDLAEVRVLSPKISHWVVKPEYSPNLEWDAEVVAERAGESISWRSVENSEVKQSGTVWFLRAPAGRGTIVKLAMDFEISGGGNWLSSPLSLLAKTPTRSSSRISVDSKPIWKPVKFRPSRASRAGAKTTSRNFHTNAI